MKGIGSLLGIARRHKDDIFGQNPNKTPKFSGFRTTWFTYQRGARQPKRSGHRESNETLPDKSPNCACGLIWKLKPIYIETAILQPILGAQLAKAHYSRGEKSTHENVKGTRSAAAKRIVIETWILREAVNNGRGLKLTYVNDLAHPAPFTLFTWNGSCWIVRETGGYDLYRRFRVFP